MSPANPSYEDIELLIQSADNLEGASEIHGMITGFICARPEDSFTHWLSTVDFSISHSRDRDMLEQLFGQVTEILSRQEFDFDLMLPDDDAPSTTRAMAVSHWVQGFLYGLGFQGDDRQWPEDIQTVLLDLTRIVQLDPQVSDEDDEQALMEITEYIKISVQLIYAELNQPATQPTLH
ncbi:MAG: UPF0149 family protein [Gammaproteobacteria bacterium]|nr:UPF0149 family protein [Gammaproteobacteria bacterium]